MDYNHDNNHPNNENQGNENWDRWNSNASNSSYYNQPTHRPYGQAFIIASGICGFLSVAMCCTGVLSLPLGALGILFALLAYRKGKSLATGGVLGIVFSAIGMVFALFTLIYTLIMMPVLMQDEVFSEQLDMVTEQMYGMDFAEFMEEFYGYSIEGNTTEE